MIDPRMTRTWAEISLSALRHNARELRRSLPEGSALLGVVKANAYGHGAIPVAAALREAGCAYLAVACAEEALELRRAGETLPILILGAADAAFAPALAAAEVTLAVECAEKGRDLSAALAPGQTLKIHIKLDTGMGRLGFPAGDAEALRTAAAVMALPGMVTEGVFTHFSVSDTPGGERYTAGQLALFRAAADKLEELSGKKIPLRHCANSGAMVYHRDEGVCMDLVRPGLLTYGILPGEETGGLSLTPVMTVKSRIAAVTRHRKGDSISYGRTWTAERDTLLAVMPMGYADGLPRCLSGKLQVMVRGVRVPQVGRICMDMCMLDITDHPEIAPGDVATVFSDGTGGAPTARELAALADTIPYELTCGISLRVPRVYSDDV